MIRISTIFTAICMVLVSASLGLVLYSGAGFGASESAIVALTALTLFILYNALTMRLRDRNAASTQISDLSRGTADLARQVAEFGRRLAAAESKINAVHATGQDRIHSVIGEISELGILVKQLATSVAGHDEMFANAPQPSPPEPPRLAAPDMIAAPAPYPADRGEMSSPAAMAEETASAVRHPPEPNPAPKPAPKLEPKTAPDLAPLAAEDDAHTVAIIRNAIAENRIDIYLQPIVTLPQRKVRFYEAVTRLRDDKDQMIVAKDFIGAAEFAGLMGSIDHAVMLRCMHVLRRLLLRNKDVGIFCNVAGVTLSNAADFKQYIDFLEANRALAASFVLEFKQSAFRTLGPIGTEHLAALAQRGYRFSIDHVTDLRIEPRELADRGVRFIKVPAALLLDQRQAQAADIHPADLSDLLGRHGIDLIAERIEGERAVVDLLDYDVRFGQGFLFAAPRPLRPEALAGGDRPTTPATASPDANGSAQPATSEPPKPAPRTTGNAALARRAVSPN